MSIAHPELTALIEALPTRRFLWVHDAEARLLTQYAGSGAVEDRLDSDTVQVMESLTHRDDVWSPERAATVLLNTVTLLAPNDARYERSVEFLRDTPAAIENDAEAWEGEYGRRRVDEAITLLIEIEQELDDVAMIEAVDHADAGSWVWPVTLRRAHSAIGSDETKAVS